MRQVNMTSFGDDARDTLTIAGLEKAKDWAPLPRVFPIRQVGIGET